uniref:Cytochrome P450 n=1 Tax=Graphocephala atropunctata TaxID=36148 RepID=A0A1B6M4G6_9HEMI
MAILTDSWIFDLLLLTSGLLYLFYRHLTRLHGYFKVRGIPHLKPPPYLGRGDNEDIFSKPPHEQFQQLYKCFPGERFFGFFEKEEPTLIIKDPSLMHQILIKDFVHFHNHGFRTVPDELLTQGMFHLKGDDWRSLRHKLSPTFTSGKLKLMFEQLNLSGNHMVDSISGSIGEPLDAKQVAFEFVVEAIASVAFGLDLSKKNKERSEFLSKSSSANAPGVRNMLIHIFGSFAPRLITFFQLNIFPKEVDEYFLKLTKDTKEYRRKNGIKRDDYFQMLLNLQEEEEGGGGKSLMSHSASDYNDDDAITNQFDYSSRTVDDKKKLLTDECITAQAFTFLLAGADSMATTIMFALFFIAKHPEVQKKLTEEVDYILEKRGGWSYQAVKEMTYLDMVLQETAYLPAQPCGCEGVHSPLPHPSDRHGAGARGRGHLPHQRPPHAPPAPSQPRVFHPRAICG